jgi:ubiquinone biosynthesis monooxygenase Coq7
MPAALTWPDRLIAAIDQGLKAIAAPPAATRPSPAETVAESELSASERERSAALMRVNHAGEIAAQALYHGQSLFARSPATQELLANAAREERDHLAWCAKRLDELGGRTSRLGFFWYAGSFGIGVLAGLRARDGAASRNALARSPATLARTRREERGNSVANGRR